MRIRLLAALLLFPVCVYSQERVSIKGRIINEKGDPVEYVQVGIPKLQTGTISTVDGRFEITVPQDTLEFFHVSSLPASYKVTGPDDDVVIVLHKQELGRELGSVAEVKKPFILKDIQLTINENTIPGCVASINIYRIEGKKESFVNVLHKPIYFNVADSNDPQDFDIQPDETILLEPGKYFIAFQIVGCDKDALKAFLAKPEEEQGYWEFSSYFKLFFKSSYIREVALGEMKHFSFNIGIAAKGLEYQ